MFLKEEENSLKGIPLRMTTPPFRLSLYTSIWKSLPRWLQSSRLSTAIVIRDFLYPPARGRWPSLGARMTKWNNKIHSFQRWWEVSRENRKHSDGEVALPELTFCLGF